MPEQPIQKKGSQRRNRNATVKAVYLLLNKPMRVERLAEAVDLSIRQTYRIIKHLKENRWLQCDRTYYWLTINPYFMPKPKVKEIQRRVATIYAVSYLAQRPYRASELAKVLGLNMRTTYRILSDLRASNWLIKENLTYSIQPNQTPTQNP